MSHSKNTNDITTLWGAYERPQDGEVFVHYKGGIYSIVATGYIEDTETPCVVYRSQETQLVWVRTAENFLETINHDNKNRPRFIRQADV